MPRQARKQSSTGIHHVLLKGMDNRSIFIDEGDRKKFLDQLKKAAEKGGFQVLAYCLMSNHVHLLLEEGEDLGTTMKRVTVGYVSWHNRQHGRTGHLFQNRYFSEPVETDAYLMTVVRYIHQNPVKAGLVDRAARYPWSSYHHYLDAYKGAETPVSTERVMGYFQSQEKFKAFMNQKKADKCLGYEPPQQLSDSDLLNRIRQGYDFAPGQKIESKERRDIIRSLYESENTSIRQLARVFGVSKGLVERAVQEEHQAR